MTGSLGLTIVTGADPGILERGGPRSGSPKTDKQVKYPGGGGGVGSPKGKSVVISILTTKTNRGGGVTPRPVKPSIMSDLPLPPPPQLRIASYTLLYKILYLGVIRPNSLESHYVLDPRLALYQVTYMFFSCW